MVGEDNKRQENMEKNIQRLDIGFCGMSTSVAGARDCRSSESKMFQTT